MLRTFAPSSSRHFNKYNDTRKRKKIRVKIISIFNRHLDYNAIENFDNITLSHQHSIQNLRLEGNSMERVPTQFLIGFTATLEAL